MAASTYSLSLKGKSGCEVLFGNILRRVDLNSSVADIARRIETGTVIRVYMMVP